MSNKGLSDKEAALLAAARRELAAPPAAAPPGANNSARSAVAPQAIAAAPGAPAAACVHAPLAGRALPANAAPADPRPGPDISTHMAMLLETERQANENRKRRIKRNCVILVCVVMVPAVLYSLVALIRLLAR